MDRPGFRQETIVYGDIDLKLNAMAKSIINLTGSYSRWDILSLNVRENQYEPLSSMEEAEPASTARETGEIERLKERIRLLEEKVRATERSGSPPEQG